MIAYLFLLSFVHAVLYSTANGNVVGAASSDQNPSRILSNAEILNKLRAADLPDDLVWSILQQGNDDDAIREKPEPNMNENAGKAPIEKSNDPDVGRDAMQLITTKGYPAEEHKITTEDGYFLTIHRIPHGKNEFNTYDPAAYRPAVFLQHGLTGSSTNFISDLSDESLGFVLADQGIDVWMGNMRGNTYSKGHETLSTRSKAYWQFSWDEHAKYDIPAMIQHVLDSTGAPHVYYVGHSQGTLVGFTGFSLDSNQEVAAKVKHFYALAPVYYLQNLGSSLIKVLGAQIDLIEWLFNIAGINQFSPNTWTNNFFQDQVCGDNVPKNLLCLNTFFQIGGKGKSVQRNNSRTAVYNDQMPAGTSTRNMAHFGQMTKNDHVLYYDYGSAWKNKLHYGQSTPPEYFVENMPVPVTLYEGQNDTLATELDIKSLIPRIKSTMDHKYFNDYNHIDFVLGLNAAKDIYLPMAADVASQEVKYWESRGESPSRFADRKSVMIKH